MNDYNTGSFTQFNNCLTFDPAEFVGESFTISFYAKSPNGRTKLAVYNNNGNPRYFHFYKELDTNLGNEWRYYSYTFINEDKAPTNTAIYNRIEIYAQDKLGVLVKKIKIEIGTKATDWSPAPEDVQSSIDTKANITDVYNKTEVYTKAQTDSQIKPTFTTKPRSTPRLKRIRRLK